MSHGTWCYVNLFCSGVVLGIGSVCLVELLTNGSNVVSTPSVVGVLTIVVGMTSIAVIARFQEERVIRTEFDTLMER